MFQSQDNIIHVSILLLSVLLNIKWIPFRNATLTKPNIYSASRENQFTRDGRVGGTVLDDGREEQLLKKMTMRKTNDRESVV